MMCRVQWVVLVVLFGLVLAGQASAHSRSESFSTWQVSDGGIISGALSMAAREATRIPRNSDEEEGLATRRYFAANLQVLGPEGVCGLMERGGLPRLLSQSGGYVRLEVRYDCSAQWSDDNQTVLTLTNSAFFDLVTGHIHYARVRNADGAFNEQVLTFDRQTVFLQQADAVAAPPRSTADTIFDFLNIGFDHILGGLDHLAFLAAVMILAGRWRIMALAITGFTIGHAITIALAVLEVVTPNGKMIEAGIGYTIALVAVEYIGERTGKARLLGFGLAGMLVGMTAISLIAPHPRMPDPYVLAGLALFTLFYMQLVHKLAGQGTAGHDGRVDRVDRGAARALISLRVAVTGLFGLIHGFGFGGSLLDLGIGRDQVITMLIGFNLGVELGQLAIVVAALLLFYAAARLVPKLRDPVLAELGMSALAGLGLYWFIGRAFLL